MTLLETYEQNGVSKRIYDFGERVLASLRGRFEEIDRMAELNQGKVLHAMQTHRVDAACFAATTGYGSAWSRYTPRSSAPRRRWSARRSPAAPTP